MEMCCTGIGVDLSP